MRIAVQIVRVLTGVLFIVSGLIKANDPLGLAYKMQEFFEAWTSDLEASTYFFKIPFINFFHFLHGYSLSLAVFMIVLEIMAGVALLLGWKKNGVLSLLITLIVFFTFLTGYAYTSGKFKNCGCFGDCLPITPLASFVKDVLLLLAILFLIFGQKYIKPIVTRRVQTAVLTASLVFSIAIQWYVLTYLPFADCLPFKQGNNIAEQMKIPANAVPDSFAIRFVYEKGGKQFAFSPEGLPADLASYKFVDRTDVLIRKGNAEPPIKGFALSGNTNIDSTDFVLSQPNAVLIFYNSTGKDSKAVQKGFQNIYEEAYRKRKIPVYFATTSLNELSVPYLPEAGLFKVDFTVFRTAARTNPCVYLLQQGTIKGKWSLPQTGGALEAIAQLPAQPR